MNRTSITSALAAIAITGFTHGASASVVNDPAWYKITAIGVNENGNVYVQVNKNLSWLATCSNGTYLTQVGFSVSSPAGEGMLAVATAAFLSGRSVNFDWQSDLCTGNRTRLAYLKMGD